MLRGRGYGRALLSAAMEHSRAAGFRRVELFTFDRLNAARALCREAGFRIVEEYDRDGWGPTVRLETLP